MCLIANRRQSNMPVSVIIVHQGENVYFLAQMRTECVLQYQKSTHCVPNVNFADLFGSTDHMESQMTTWNVGTA